MVHTAASRARAKERKRQRERGRRGGADRPVIRLGRRKRSAREIRKGLPLPLRILTSPVTTIGLAGTLGALLFPAAAATGGLALLRGTGRTFFGSFGRGFATLTGIGILTESARARRFAKRRVLDPTRTGRELGKLIEDPSQLFPTQERTTGEKVKEFAQKAGLIGGAAALGAGAISAVRRFREGRKETSIPSAVLPTAILPALPSLTPRTQPLGAAEKPIEAADEIMAAPIAMPSIKITNKPQINISFRKSRSFINQQLLLK